MIEREVNGVTVYELTPEEWAEMKAKAVAKFKAYHGEGDEWKDALADCHLKCSDPVSDAHHLAMILTDEEVAELYREAGLEPPS